MATAYVDDHRTAELELFARVLKVVLGASVGLSDEQRVDLIQYLVAEVLGEQ